MRGGVGGFEGGFEGVLRGFGFFQEGVGQRDCMCYCVFACLLFICLLFGWFFVCFWCVISRRSHVEKCK